MEKINTVIQFQVRREKSIIGVFSQPEAIAFLEQNGFRYDLGKICWKRQRENELEETTAQLFVLLPPDEDSIPKADSVPQEILDLLGDLGEE